MLYSGRTKKSPPAGRTGGGIERRRELRATVDEQSITVILSPSFIRFHSYPRELALKDRVEPLPSWLADKIDPLWV